MEPNIKKALLQSIGKVYEQSKECKLELKFFKSADHDIKQIANYFEVTTFQALLISTIFALNYEENKVDLKELIRHFGCNPMELIEHIDDFEVLHSKGIVMKRKNRGRVNFHADLYFINVQVSEAMLSNQPMPKVVKSEFKDVIELLGEFCKLGDQRRERDITTEELFTQAKELISANLRFPLMQRIHDYQLGKEDTYFFLYLIWETIVGNEGINVGWMTDVAFDNPSDKIFYSQNVLFGSNALRDRNFIEIGEADFFNDTEIILSPLSIKMLQEHGIKLYAHKRKPENIIEPEKIHSRELFFNDSESKQLDMLKKLLEDDNLTEIQTRLKSKGLPGGIAVLLHGAPGTGKTETVFQVAKNTNREIVKVDISQSKSMWFGKSEKIIKKIFTDYKLYAKGCDRMPILLFNEADAIISKRKDNSASNVSQTENAIQNIILEELETFEGLFFATTNLAKNLDSAFERRFLFKIELLKPNVSVKARIWSSKMPQLSTLECDMLAGLFDFSGGQIDNIVRKSEIHEIIHGIPIDFSNILGFCETELLLKENRIKVGYI